jgi:hypothetical protein
MRHTGGPLRRAVSMVVQLETYGLEARFWIVSGLPTIRPEGILHPPLPHAGAKANAVQRAG